MCVNILFDITSNMGYRRGGWVSNYQRPNFNPNPDEIKSTLALGVQTLSIRIQGGIFIYYLYTVTFVTN